MCRIVLQLLYGERETEMYMRLCELLEKHLPKPFKMNYFEGGTKKEVIVLEVRVLMQVESVHLDTSRGSYELLKKEEFCSKISTATLQQL